MNIIYLSLLGFYIINTTISCSLLTKSIYGNGIRTMGYKMIIYKEKKYPKLVELVKTKYNACYEKTIAAISDCMNDYDNLSYEEKIIVDFMLSINNFI